MASQIADSFSSGNALTDFFMKDVGITQFQFNIGQQLLSAGIVILEVCAEFRHRSTTCRNGD